MKNGELFEGDTLDEVWPQQKPLPPMWWWKQQTSTAQACARRQHHEHEFAFIDRS
jgi:hypothetical protein